MSTHKPAPSGAGGAIVRGRGLVLLLVAAVSLVGIGFAGLTYQQYAAVWARRPPRAPRCILAARIALRRVAAVSGTEPHDTADGRTVYLRPNEDRAVRCLLGFSKNLAGHFAAAFAEIEPEARARLLLGAVRDGVPPDPGGDQDAVAGFLLASGAFKALPASPAIKAAEGELLQLNACRFPMRTPCPSRPPIPSSVWFAGVPSAGGMAIVMGFGIRSAVMRIRDAWRRRRGRKSAAKR